MRTPEDCLKAAWAALLEGDTGERDRQCALAEHMLEQQRRILAGGEKAMSASPIIQLIEQNDGSFKPKEQPND